MTEGTFEAVSVIAKVRLPRFFSYQFFKSANIGVKTAASIQPNPFWFWEKYHPFFRTLVKDGFGDTSVQRNVRKGHINIQLIKQHMV